MLIFFGSGVVNGIRKMSNFDIVNSSVLPGTVYSEGLKLRSIPEDETPLSSSESANGKSNAITEGSEKERPRKRRKSTVRACDACAIRKVKCEEKRPCTHCINNNLKCTQYRERKKSGPKNLHKKTLESINSFSENKEPILKPITHTKRSPSNLVTVLDLLSSKHPNHPVESVPDILATKVASRPDDKDIKISRNEIIDILKAANDEMVKQGLQNLTVSSVLANVEKYINLVRLSYLFSDNRGDVLNADLSVLSLVLVIVTLCLLIVETLLKLQILDYRLETLKSDTATLKRLKQSLQRRIVEFLVPFTQASVFPTSSVQLSNNPLVFYNQSLASIHLFSFHQITTHLNMHNQNQQKLDQLRKSITYYQLITIPFQSTLELTVVQLYELYEFLFTIESVYFFFSSEFFVRTNNLLLNEWNKNIQVRKESLDSSLFEIFKIINKEELVWCKPIGHLFRFSLYNSNEVFQIRNIKNLQNSKVTDTSSYFRIKSYLNALTSTEPFFQIVKSIVLFKITIIHSDDLVFDVLKGELMEIVSGISKYLENKNDYFKLQISNYQLLPHLLQILIFNIEIDEEHVELNRKSLVRFTQNLMKFFAICGGNRLIHSNESLHNWFKNLSKKSHDLTPENEENELLLNNILSSFDTSYLSSYSNTLDAYNDSYSSSLKRSIPSFRSFDPIQSNLNDELDAGITDSNSTRNVPIGPSVSQLNVTNPITTGTNNIRQTGRSVEGSSSLNTQLEVMPTSVAANSATTAIKNDELSELISLSLSESTKNLYNTFHQVGDDFPRNNSSLSNLLQYGATNADWNSNNDDARNQNCNFLL